jgi:hypothetical protein
MCAAHWHRLSDPAAIHCMPYVTDIVCVPATTLSNPSPICLRFARSTIYDPGTNQSAAGGTKKSVKDQTTMHLMRFSS